MIDRHYSCVIIQNYSPSISYSINKNNRTNNYKISSLPCDTVSFQGHAGIERYAKNGIDYLKHETAFFREATTDNFVKNFIKDNFAEKNKIKIVIGGCSTGEEAVTYSMLLDDMKNKVDILGFDLSKTSIEQAKKRTYLFHKPNEKEKEELESMGVAAYRDSYLVFDSKKQLTDDEKQNKVLFDKFFEKSDEIVENKKPLIERFQDWLISKIYKEPPMAMQKKLYKLKDGKADNCKFIQGDIEDIRGIVGEKKADVILFRNAMYHLTTKEIGYEATRVPRKNSPIIVENICKKMKDSLSDNGLLVFGKNEHSQMVDENTLPNVMMKLGFKPLNKLDNKQATVWQKVS